MKQKITTGILSYGLSGSLFHAPFLNSHDGFEWVAVTERSTKKAQRSFPEVVSYDSVDALIADPSIELVVVNTPNYSHFDYAKKALEANKHVLIEKPFTVTSNEAQQLFGLAKEKDLQLFPYQNRRFDSDFLSVKEVVDSGKLGELVEVHMRFDRYRYDIGTKVAKETKVPGSGILYDLGPHLIDAAIALFGIPDAWRKTQGKFRPDTEVDDFAQLQLTYPSGLNVFLTMSMLVADVQPAFVLHGTKGSFVKQRADVQEQQLADGLSPLNSNYGIEKKEHFGCLTTISADGRRKVESISAAPSSYMRLFDAVFASIRTGAPYFVKEEEVIQQLKILEG